MKIIFLAAGPANRLRPLTNNFPKCMLKIKEKSILEHGFDAFKKHNLNNFVIIKGHAANKINFPNIKHYYNKNYLNNNILASLFYAEPEMNEEFICTYSDIIYTPEIVKKLLQSKADFSVVVDKNWIKNYEERTQHPIEEAENVIINNGKIIKVGKHLTAEESHGEFIGMAKFSKKGARILKKVYSELKKKNKPFQKAKTFEKAYLTDMFQELIDRGYNIYPVVINGGWKEFDTIEDFENFNKDKMEVLK